MNEPSSTSAIMRAHRAWGLRNQPHAVREPQPEPAEETLSEKLDRLTKRAIHAAERERVARFAENEAEAAYWAEVYEKVDDELSDIELALAGL